MAPGDQSLFRQAALDRLASPEKLDARPSLPVYSRALAVATLLLAAAVIAFAAWLR